MAQSIENKRLLEQRVVGEMISLFCRTRHSSRGSLCPQCAALAKYALERSRRCPFIETKTFCSNCKVHCYRPDMREQIRVVMRFSGPRMLLHHPVIAVRHLIETKREQKRLEVSV